MGKTILFVFTCLISQNLVQSAEVFDVLKYGAKHDGTHKNTAEIAKAIEAASAATGGGTVHFPKGHYLTGPIHLKSNVNLQLDDGVVIKFSDNFDDYLPMVKVRDGGIDMMGFTPLIYGDHVSHVSITGKGNATLDGSGEKWWTFYNHLREEHKKTGHWNTNGSKWQQEFLKANADLHKAYPEEMSHNFIRPSFFQPMNSEHITLEGVTFINSPSWHLHPTYTDHVKIDHVKVIAPASAPNTDGIDPDSCRFVTISNVFVSVGDDCVCIKSGKDKQGRTINRPSENITVIDSVMHSGHGGIVIGSEMSGSVRHITARNLTFDGTNIGIRIKSGRGRGGVVEHVHISDIKMHHITHEGITINTYYTQGPEETFSERTPIFRDIHIENVTGDSKLGIQILGLPEKHLDQITLKNVHMTAKQDIVVKDADHVTRTNVTITIDKHL